MSRVSAAYVIRLAARAMVRPTVQNPMLSSADLCLRDARACAARGDHEHAVTRALASMSYTLGAFSDVYRRNRDRYVKFGATM